MVESHQSLLAVCLLHWAQNRRGPRRQDHLKLLSYPSLIVSRASTPYPLVVPYLNGASPDLLRLVVHIAKLDGFDPVIGFHDNGDQCTDILNTSIVPTSMAGETDFVGERSIWALFAVAATSDFIIAFSSTSDMLYGLMRQVVISGLATSTCSLLTVVTYLVWKDSLIFLGVDLILSKCQAYSRFALDDQSDVLQYMLIPYLAKSMKTMCWVISTRHDEKVLCTYVSLEVSTLIDLGVPWSASFV
ncbi:hypothetical protein EV421DRAFT_1910375 [Armillaria borealis]|uniref:Uncharacterized protein n=1 Tax=Armillaria borealis TaxID=47425 RepID=A0AA39J264_9AGAR|nr:hypothetical protein EV421DRAFT_1910375 [Armillaria borealis]